MFYDERIEFEKGKISRNCIFLSVIGALCFAIAQLANILLTIESPQFHHYMNAFMPVFIFLAGAVSLIYGLYLEKSEHDERTRAEAYAFYSRAARRILLLVAVLFGILLPYTIVNPMPTYNFYSVPFYYVLWILFYPVCTYCVYSFKKHEIYFNYSLLESEHYYRGVFKNIGKLSLWALGVLAESLFFYILLYIFKHMNNMENYIPQMFYSFFEILFTIMVIYIVLATLYLALSALEKASYDNETRLISLSTVVSFAVAACLTLVSLFVTFESSYIINSLANSNIPADFPLSSVVAAASYIINFINSGIYIFLLLCITYFGYEYSRVYKNRLLHGSLCTILAIKAANMVISPLSNLIFAIITIKSGSNNLIYGEISLYYSYLIGFAEVVAVILIIAALMKDGFSHKVGIALISVIAVMLCVMIFLTTQLSSINISKAFALFNSFIYLCLAVLVAIIGRKNIHSIDK